MRAADGFMDNYNYHDWAKFMVEKPEQIPKGPHFAAVLLDKRREYSPAYDDRDSGRSYEVSQAVYFAFPDKKTLESWLLRAMKENKQFFFFEVKKLGDVSLKVAVSTDT